ncbi:hypothetical protein [Streptomyces carpaticus]|uniref:hypothetical protein n=1 Tax=Streptomyces carpaticus TaxID=285558 RepID=UPI0031FA434D
MKLILTDCRLFTSGVDLSGASNKVELSAEAEERDATNFRSGGWKEVIAGLTSGTVSAEGHWSAGDPAAVDDATWAQLGGRGPWTVCPEEATVGALAYTTVALRTSYKLGATVGEIAPWSAEAATSGPVVRGAIAHPPGIARSGSGAGEPIEIGTVPTGGRLVAALHVLSAPGTGTLAVTVETAPAEDAWTEPDTSLFFDPVPGPGGQMVSVIAPTAGPWARPTWTVDGSGSFLFVLALSVQ